MMAMSMHSANLCSGMRASIGPPLLGPLQAGLPISVMTTVGLMAVEAVGKFLYVASKFNQSVWAFRIGSDGALTPIEDSPLVAGRGPNSVAFGLAPEQFARTMNG